MREAYVTIHHALHSDVAVVTVDGIDYPILKAGNGCRYVTFEGIRVMQQNIHKSSVYADRARSGEKISWAMTEPNWTLIDDAAINLFSQKVGGLPKITDNVPRERVQPDNPTGPKKRTTQTDKGRGPGNFWRSPQ